MWLYDLCTRFVHLLFMIPRQDNYLARAKRVLLAEVNEEKGHLKRREHARDDAARTFL